MANDVKQLVGLKEIRYGSPLPDGILTETDGMTLTEAAQTLIKAWKPLTQPYQGGVTINATRPTSNKWYKEGAKYPAQSLRDPSSGGMTATWRTMDYDTKTKAFYFGETSKERADVFEREVGVAFISESGPMCIAARMKITSIPGGGLASSGDPLLIDSEGEILAPVNGGIGWDVVNPITFSDEPNTGEE